VKILNEPITVSREPRRMSLSPTYRRWEGAGSPLAHGKSGDLPEIHPLLDDGKVHGRIILVFRLWIFLLPKSRTYCTKCS